MYFVLVSTIGIFLFSSIVSVHGNQGQAIADVVTRDTTLSQQVLSADDMIMAKKQVLPQSAAGAQQSEGLKFFNASEMDSYEVNVSRRFIFLRWGLVRESTTIDVQYDGETGFNAMNVTIPNYDFKHVNYLDIRYKQGSENASSDRVTLVDEMEVDDARVYVVSFPEVSKGQNISIIINADLVGAFRVKSPGIVHEGFPYVFNYTFQPLITFPITKIRVTFEAADAPSFKFDNSTLTPSNLPWKQETAYLEFNNITTYDFITDYKDALEQEGYNLTALGNKEFIPAYTSTLNASLKNQIRSLFLSFDATHKDAPLIQYDSMSVTVDIGEWGKTTVTEKIVMRHVGTNTTGANLDIGDVNYKQHSLFIPSINATYLRGRDPIGNLTVQQVKLFSLNLTEIRVTPRIPIRFNQTYSFEISYEIPNEAIIERVGGDLLNYKGYLGSYINWTVVNYQLTVIFPIGAGVDKNNVTESLVQSIASPFVDKTFGNSDKIVTGFLGFINNRYAISFTAQNITSAYNVQVNVFFSYPVWNYLFSAVPWISLGLLLTALYVALRIVNYGRLFRGIRTPKVIEEEIPVDLIRDFVERYQDITVLRRRLAELEEDRARKRVKASEFRKQQSILTQKLREAERKMVKSAQQLSKVGRKYADRIRTLQQREDERLDILNNLRNLENRRKEGRISKDVYARRRADLEGQLRKVDTQIERILLELRNLLTR